ncbi:peptide deformylase [Acinetobacter pollinis]|uniref:peptide deformylase n=1 Tax=Acinetobacter pollinis TaxID=2605270 RepID=UPI0018A33AF9|nr:peptide deformylase [Acinetobacter pollinis]MBF7689170.1 peptide deformylase [Acinetobacter pollinis]MBF7691832.1 peptide deformylase [Acinetobacter pollinis]MBF7698322.1 peptide deformylase [Acinetobacter pollinis]MBF7699937.1 peptide deformylase [Acinetobacter pollinis]
MEDVVLPVAQKGEEVLNLVATKVSPREFGSLWLHQLSQAMQTTMKYHHGVGIAAPQVYVSKRIIIVASRPNPRYPDAPDMPEIVMVNPEILTASNEKCLGEEGCLSVKGERGRVLRAQKIVVEYYTVMGERIQQTFVGFPARIVQHEIDHLNGILFVSYL